MKQSIIAPCKTVFAIIILSIINTSPSYGQFLKKLKDVAKDAAARTIERKVEEKSEQTTEAAMDSLFAIKLNRKKDSLELVSDNSSNSSYTNDQELMQEEYHDDPMEMDVMEENTMTELQTEVSTNQNIVNYRSDFETGAKELVYEDFSTDGLYDFPISWNTNSSGAIVTFNNDNQRWLRLDAGEFTPDRITEIPQNATLEFDLKVDDSYNWVKSGICISIAQFDNRLKDFTNWTSRGFQYNTNPTGIKLLLDPIEHRGKGNTTIATYIDGEKILTKTKPLEYFSSQQKTVHVGIWKQKTRLRVYIDGQKIWDLPRAFADRPYNGVAFSTASGGEQDVFYISNIRLASAEKDKRHQLLEEGSFTTNEILFESNEASILPTSTRVLSSLGKALVANPTVEILIVGHTDSDGTATFNQSLSERRAQSVKQYLMTHHAIDGSRLICQGKGAQEPLVDNATVEGRAQNRRVEFIKIK